MIDELLAAYTSLPNLHPAVVHFPIALLPLAVLGDLAAALSRRPFWDRLAALLLAVGALGAWAAIESGERADESLIGVPAAVTPRIGEHSDWAHRVLYVFAVLAAVRLYLAWRDRRATVSTLRAVRLALALVGVAGLGLLFGTADRGGELVYKHGLAVSRAEATPEPAPRSPPRPDETAGPPESRLLTGEGGVLRWTPLPADGAALGTLLRPAEGFEPAAVGAVPAGQTPGAGRGLGLEVQGVTVLVLDPVLADVQVDAELDASGFEGRLGVAHHVRGLDDRAHFAVSNAGTAELIDLRGGERRVLDEEPATASGVFTLSVSSAGRHLRGLLDGRQVVHGHVEPPAPGRAGLLLDGRGSVRVISLTVTPL